MKVLIIEDELLSARRLQSLLLAYDPDIEVVGILASVKESVRFLNHTENTRPDLIFLDIHLEDDLGFKIIEQQNLFIPVIFTTAFNEYMLRAFKTNSVDYLLKPIDKDELKDSLNKFKRLQSEKKDNAAEDHLKEVVTRFSEKESYRDRFLISAGNRLFSVRTVEIAYFVIEQKATFFKTFDGRYFALDYSLDRLSLMLDPNQFFRVNRSMLVAHESIESIMAMAPAKLKLELTPPAREEVFVSIDRMTEFKNWLGK